MNSVLHQIFAFHAEQLALVFMVCMLGFAFIEAIAPIAGLAYVSFPFMVVGALLARLYLLDNPIILRLDAGPAIVLSSVIGMTTAVITVVVMVRIGMFLRDLVVRQPELIAKSMAEKGE